MCLYYLAFHYSRVSPSKTIVLPIHTTPSHHLSAKLIGQLLLDLLDLPSLAVVSQCPCHLLVGHFLAVAFLNAPAVSQCFFVLGGELESALILIHPPDAIFHISTSKQVKKKLVQSDFLFAACRKK